jgi:hypothetical protein
MYPAAQQPGHGDRHRGGIIIQSGNDASKAIAEHTGSKRASPSFMNAEAQRLGMTNTNFVNATGLPDPAHKASARDLAILARAIIRDSADYYPIYAEREFKFNNIKQGNRNALLYTDPTVDGLKTGHTQEAGYCLVTSSKRNGMRLITVILNTNSAQARADETRTLLGWGFSNFEKATPIQPNTVVTKAKVTFGKVDTVDAALGSPWTVTVPRGAVRTTVQTARPGGAGQGCGGRQGDCGIERQAGGRNDPGRASRGNAQGSCCARQRGQVVWQRRHRVTGRDPRAAGSPVPRATAPRSEVGGGEAGDRWRGLPASSAATMRRRPRGPGARTQCARSDRLRGE